MNRVNGIEVGSCEACPIVNDCFEYMAELDERAQAIADVALDPSIDDRMQEVEEMLANSGFFDQMQEITGQPPFSASQITTTVRRQTAAHLDHLDEHKEEAADRIRGLTADCEGPLRMRASKAGQTVTATVCISQVAPNGSSHEPVHVDRKRTKQAEQ